MANNTQNASGAVYTYTRVVGGAWSPQTYVKASKTGADDWFGRSVALSADGNTLAVGAYGEDSAATGVYDLSVIPRPQTTTDALANNTQGGSGAVYTYARVGGAWSPQAYVKANNTGVFDQFGYSVALSANGNTLVVGAPLEDGGASGIDGDQTVSSYDAGAAYVFNLSNGNPSQQAYVKASNTKPEDHFGSALAISTNGDTLAVGSAAYQGKSVDLYASTDRIWRPLVNIAGPNISSYDGFGSAIALSSDGNLLAIGAPFEPSNAIGIGGNKTDSSVAGAGAIYIFARNSTANPIGWSMQAYVKASNTGADDYFGRSVALSADGNTLAVGTPNEDSAATGVNNTAPGQADNSALGAGAVYVY
ncbi:MAG: hypothetical protein AABY83_08660 [Pseudomonadota bacterium]